MADIAVVAVYALAAATIVVLYAVAWRATRASTTGVKLVARVIAPVVIVIPLIALTALTWRSADMAAPPATSGASPPPRSAADAAKMREAKEAAERAEENARAERAKMEEARRLEVERQAQEAGRAMGGEAPPAASDSDGPQSAPPAQDDAPSAVTEGAGPDRKTDGTVETYSRKKSKLKADDETAPAAETAAPEPAKPTEPALSQPAQPPASPPPVGAAPPPPAASAPAEPAPRDIDLGARSGGGAGAPSASGAAAPSAGTSEGDWDVVPVFYGTDRTQAANTKRVDYGSGRGRRLELGRALVTVPKLHKVPAIERPWAIRIPYLNVTLYEEAEDPKSHFTMKEIQTLSQEEFMALVRERLAASRAYKDHAFIFIHGYNTSFDYAIYRTAQIAYDLKFDGAPFAYSWPSGGGLASYTYDRESSGQAEPFLKTFMELVIKQTGAKSVSVIAHSMGNQPTLQVLKDLKASRPSGVLISQIILAAPDVDRDNFENIAQSIQGLANGVTLYAAANDRALMVSRNFYGGIPRAGDVPATGPLVLPGVDTIDVTAASMDGLGLNHSGYAENNALLSDIGLLILSGTRPPGTRTPGLEEILTAKGPYWRYRASR